MAKKIGLISASFLGLTSIIGSGWLFASYRAAQVAGPASILSWVIAMVVIALLAFCLVEIAARFPLRGLSAAIPSLTHNKYFGFPFAIANWLGIVAVIGLEAEAVIQYCVTLVPSLQCKFFVNGELTGLGDSLVVVLVVIFTLLNFWGARLMVRVNNTLSILKVIIPIIVALAIIFVAFHPSNFTYVKGSFMPCGVGSIFTAILNTGIIIAFNGFQTVASFASEVKKPGRTIGLSILIALVVSLVIYVLLQVAFVGAMPHSQLSDGWTGLKMAAPVIELLGLLGLTMFVSMAYFGSVIAPAGTGMAFVGSATRMFTAMSRQGQMPRYFRAVHTLYGVSRRSLIVNMFLSILFVVCFRSWDSLAQILSLFHIMAYLPILLGVWVFRKYCRDHSAEFYRMPCGKIFAVLLFVFFTCLFARACWSLMRDVLVLFFIFQIIYLVGISRSWSAFGEGCRKSMGLVIYFGGLGLLAWGWGQLCPNASDGIEYTVATGIWGVISFMLLYYQAKPDVSKLENLQKGDGSE